MNDAAALMVEQRERPVREVLDAIEAYEAAESLLRHRLQGVLGIGATDLVAFRFIRNCELEGRPVRPRDLELRLHTSSAAATAITNRLKAAGLIDKPVHEHDRRSRVLRVTEHGHDRLAAVLGRSPQQLDQLLDTVTDIETARLVDLLRGLTRIIEATARV